MYTFERHRTCLSDANTRQYNILNALRSLRLLQEPSMFAMKAPDGIKKCDSIAEQKNMCHRVEV